ncbi:MAG: response regulator transcription factor [Anaerolineae bacterium]|nr:response regulator transcription factor [Anaerolineae bacterium]
MSDTSLSILIVEDDEFTRRGMRLFLEQGGNRVVEADNVHDALRLATDHQPDVAVVDLVLPSSPGAEQDYASRVGLEVIQQLKARYPHLAIVILSAHPDQGAAILEMVQRKRWQGVAYLLKGGRAAAVEQAIHLAKQGGVYFDPSVSLEARSTGSQIILDALTASEREVVVEALNHLPCLTPRESDVLRQIAESLGPEQAAAALNISPKTWNNHRQSIYVKLGLNADQADSLRKEILLAKIALIHRLEAALHEERGL